MNVDNLNNLRREASIHFMNKNKTYLKADIENLETYSKIKNLGNFYMDISDFKKGYQPGINIVKDGTGDLVTRIPEYSGWVKELFLPVIECTWRP